MNREDALKLIADIYDSIKNIELRLRHVEEYTKRIWDVRENVINISVNGNKYRKELSFETEEDEKRTRRLENKKNKPPKEPIYLIEKDDL
jgi:1-aminocyclopropane-1-carboxylate deaminase/D-cysteine desulfhydrase-like pyridoxal-dependent ACC family enzyme